MLSFILLILSIVAAGLGCLIGINVLSVIHQIAALICFLISAVLFSGACITDRIGNVVAELRKLRSEASAREKKRDPLPSQGDFEEIR